MKRREFIQSVIGAAALPLHLPAPGMHASAAPADGASRLPARTLGKTGVEVSALALGGVIGMQREPSPDFDPVAIAEAALQAGVTYFDTAPSYNNGQSESNYGQALARRRKEVFLACKTGDRTYDGTMRSVEQSLKRLRTGWVDLLQIHGVTAGEDLDAWGKPGGVYSALMKLRDQKVTRFVGVTGHDSAEVLLRAIEMYEFDTLLTTLNPVARRRPYREELLPAANRKGMGVIAMKVMGGGNGCLAAGNPFRKVLRSYHDETRQQARAETLVRYTLSLPVSAAVIGAASVEQVTANAGLVRAWMPMDGAECTDLERSMA